MDIWKFSSVYWKLFYIDIINELNTICILQLIILTVGGDEIFDSSEKEIISNLPECSNEKKLPYW